MNIIRKILTRIRGGEPLSIYDVSDLIVKNIREKGGSVGENVSIIDSVIDET